MLHRHVHKQTAPTPSASLGPPENIVGPAHILAYISDADCIAGCYLSLDFHIQARVALWLWLWLWRCVEPHHFTNPATISTRSASVLGIK